MQRMLLAGESRPNFKCSPSLSYMGYSSLCLPLSLFGSSRCKLVAHRRCMSSSFPRMSALGRIEMWQTVAGMLSQMSRRQIVPDTISHNSATCCEQYRDRVRQLATCQHATRTPQVISAMLHAWEDALAILQLLRGCEGRACTSWQSQATASSARLGELQCGLAKHCARSPVAAGHAAGANDEAREIPKRSFPP